MNFKQKLAYMAIGCVFTLAGYFLATLVAGGVNPQNASAQAGDKQIIDEIVCRKLKVVNAAGESVAVLGVSDGDGVLTINSKSGKAVAGLGVEDDAGILSIANKNEIEVATLKGYLGSGRLSLSNKEGMTRAVLAASPSNYLPSIYREREREGEDGATLSSRAYGYEDSGFLSISNKNGHEVATLGATSDGGILSIYNKNSKVSARVGVDIHGWGGFQYFKGKWRIH